MANLAMNIGCDASGRRVLWSSAACEAIAVEILAIALVWRRRRQFLSRMPDPHDLLADLGERCPKGKVSAPVAGRDGS
jgi:hypothetical protein